MTGKEVKDYLEYSYDKWIQDPQATGHALLLNKSGRLVNNYYNLDSAAGIIYTVDVTAEKGRRVKIVSMADGRKFDKRKTYKVALNSYRASGGGGHLEFGAGIPFHDIKSRILKSFDGDLRGLIIEDFENQYKSGAKMTLNPLGQWKFTPDGVAGEALKKDLELFK